MRLDYALYVVAALFFITTAAVSILLVETARSLSVVTTVVLGIMFVGLGYYMRPKTTAPQACQPAVLIPQATTPQTQPTAPVETAHVESSQALMEAPVTPLATEPPPVVEAPVMTEMPPTTEAPAPAPSISELTRVKGIGEKRAAQLKALGINSIEDLAQASARDVAKKLQISPKFVTKWIAGAKELVK